MIIITLCTCTLHMRAQDISYAQFYNTPSLINPNWINAEKAPTFLLHIRQQPIRISDEQLEDNSENYTTFMAAYGQRVGKKRDSARLGLGITLVYDRQPGAFTSNGIILQGSYRWDFARFGQLSWGAEFGYFSQGIGNNFTTDAQFTPSGFDPNAANGENFSSLNTFYPILGLGASFHSLDQNFKFYLGVSLHNSMQRADIFLQESNQFNFEMPKTWLITGGLPIPQNRPSKWQLQPNFRFIKRFDSQDLDIGSWIAMANPKSNTNIRAGFWYNTRQAFNFALSIPLPLFNKSELNVHYDAPISSQAGNWLGPNLGGQIQGAFGMTGIFQLKPRPPLAPAKDYILDFNYDNIRVLLEEQSEEAWQKAEAKRQEWLEDREAKTDFNLAYLQNTPQVPKYKATGLLESYWYPKPITVQFKYEAKTDNLSLEPISITKLKRLALNLLKFPGTNIEIIGYVKDSQSQRMDDTLFQEMNLKVEKYLKNLGIREKRISGGNQVAISDEATPFQASQFIKSSKFIKYLLLIRDRD